MSGFRTGRFHRHKVSPLFRRFCPIRAEESILSIDPAQLVTLGKKLVLLDVDNTLVVWRSEEIAEAAHDWVRRAKDAGLELCILSNTRNPRRLERLAGRLDIPFFFGKFKPSTHMYEQALAKFGRKPEEAVMIGDQLFTDVFGANRAGIEAIWVRQMAPVDFVGTKISRLGERLLRNRLYLAMAEEAQPNPPLPPMNGGERGVGGEGTADQSPDEDLHVGGTAAFDLLQHPTVRQFVKFVIIGGTSTIIDGGIYWLLMFHVPAGAGLLGEQLGQTLLDRFPAAFTALATKDGVLTPYLAAGPVFKVFSTGVAILNSFVWNRRWTFKIRGKEHRAVQLRKFFTIALIGLVLNAVITTALGNVIPGHPKRSLAVGFAIATVITAFWNFFGQKLWTFKK